MTTLEKIHLIHHSCCGWAITMVKNKQEQNAQRTPKNKALQQWTINTRYMTYLWIPPPQKTLSLINISIYINEKLHTSFENTLTKQRPHL